MTEVAEVVLVEAALVLVVVTVVIVLAALLLVVVVIVETALVSSSSCSSNSRSSISTTNISSSSSSSRSSSSSSSSNSRISIIQYRGSSRKRQYTIGRRGRSGSTLDPTRKVLGLKLGPQTSYNKLHYTKTLFYPLIIFLKNWAQNKNV